MGLASEGLKGLARARALLDMGKAARMERAREMGFDTERVLYHGTRSDIDELRPSAGGEYGRGVYLSENPDTAAQFAAYAKGDAGQNIIPVYVRTRSPLVTESRDEARRLGPSGLRRKGFDSVEGTNPVSGEKQTVVLDPSDIRSVNAAFDPAKRDSSNLLAGVGGAAVGAGLLAAPSDIQAAPIGSGARAGMKLYRAHRRDAPDTIHKWTSWSPDRETAEAYIDNPGFGGPNLREVDAPVNPDAVLDLSSREGVDFERLAQALGYDDPAEVADEWRMSGYRYPWEESGEARRRLESSDYEWVRYADDYPEDGVTMVPLRDFSLGKPDGRGAAGFARPGAMAAVGAGGALAAYDPVEARQTARRKREIDGLVDTMLEDFRRSAAAPRPDTPRFETLAQLAEWARAQRTVGMPLYGQPLAGTADTLDRLAYGDYRRGREGLGTLAMDALTTAAEVFDPGTWATLGRQAQQDLINQVTDRRTRANR